MWDSNRYKPPFGSFDRTSSSLPAMLIRKLPRALSIFNTTTQRWTAIPLRDPQQSATPTPSSPHQDHAISKQSLSLATWNIQASSSGPAARCERVLEHILNGSTPAPDIIFLQEVTFGARQALLDNPAVRAGFLTTDAEDGRAFIDLPFATMTLLSRQRFGSPWTAAGQLDEGRGTRFLLDSVCRIALPSMYRRDALCVDIVAPAAPDTVIRLLNVHLDSLNTHQWRAQQLDVLAGDLRQHGCTGGIIAGDFNAIRPEDHALIDKHKLVDAWVALRGSDGGATWGVGMGHKDGRKGGRFDKVAMLGLKPDEVEVVQPGRIEIARPAQPSLFLPWSDHCGLTCTFTV